MYLLADIIIFFLINAISAEQSLIGTYLIETTTLPKDLDLDVEMNESRCASALRPKNVSAPYWTKSGTEKLLHA